MTVETWLQAAVADTKQRGLPELKPLLEALARATAALRAADFNQSPVASHQSPVANPESPIVGGESPAAGRQR